MAAMWERDITAVRESEIGDIAALEREVFGSGGYPLPTLRQFFDLAGPLFVRASSRGELVGYGIALPSAGSRDGWILSVAVRQDLRRQGVGSALVKALVEQARTAGLDTLRLTVDPANAAARTFYEALGFVEEKAVRDYFGSGMDRIVMRTTVASPSRLHNAPSEQRHI